jgi:hypothetical protein
MLFNPNFRKGGSRAGILGTGEADQGSGLQLEFNSLAHLVQKLTSYEQRHPKLYQDRIERQVTFIDAEDSGDDQEVAVAEWTRGANPVSCKWVK